MKKQRSLDSRRQNRLKQVRKRQRKAKAQIHRTHLRARLDQIHQALDAPLPPDWAILYPELKEALFLPDAGSTEWAVFESAAPWFARLSRQKGRHFSRKKERPISEFTLDLIILTHCLMGATF